MYTPNPAFKFTFRISIEGISDVNDPEYFYAVEGLGLTYAVEKYAPGGYERSYSMPTMYETDNLVLKRPLLEDKTNITKWCEQALDTNVFKPAIVHIFILNKDSTINNHWSAEQAYPIGFRLSALEVEVGTSSIVVETITLAYTRLFRVK